jgi:hypothetical protein
MEINTSIIIIILISIKRHNKKKIVVIGIYISFEISQCLNTSSSYAGKRFIIKILI